LQAFASPPKHENMLPLRAGAVLSDGKYEVEHQLGAGGLGTAYLARDRQQAKVVLKEFILPVYVDAAICRQALKAFEAEARILKGLDHPNIVRLFDFFVQDQRAYMVLEYIDGPSLKLYVQQQGQPLPAKDAVKFALQICEALSHLHAQSPPVVHRDVTPDNLILSRDGTIKLIDFNVAQQAETNTTAIFVGKPGYLPPEQFRGEPSVHSDIFAAGASLHFLLTGKDPIALTVSRPKLIQHAVPAPLDDIVAKATALDIKDRYTSVEEFKQALLAQQ
jgi:serine/threonine protein kinase, bacterial